ncbi:kinase-like domain-containing protein [Rhizophagus clarus]|uniref:Kinase-like domain-containing protein n=1 Tax=Rhizophagus clarus TaxID=94130 RepID=A0A8H3MCG8_9GLOM|nr:kinase-like domain-containing protein [Rhizophagus clarus]
MSITLLCLVKGNTTANAFPVDIEKDRLVGHLKEAIKAKKQSDFAGVDADKLKLWKVEIPDDQDDQLANPLLNDQTELLATRDIGDYWTGKPPKRHINIIVKSPLLSLEEALSCVPPPVTYSSGCVTTKTTTKVNGEPPSKVLLWRNLFDQVNSYRFDQHSTFESPRFVVKEVVNEEDVRVAMDVNICMVLSGLMVPGYNFSRLPTHTTGVSDFTCFYLSNLLVLTIEYPLHVRQPLVSETGIHEALDLQNPSVAVYFSSGSQDICVSRSLGTIRSHSPHPLQVLVQADVDNNSRVLRSHSKLSSYQVPDNQSPSSHTQTYNVSVEQQKFSFADFKFQSILGEGRSGKTLRCEYRGNTIALKSADLSKTLPDVLKEMKKEVEIYKVLADVQGKCIPKLICYGYYCGGMSFVIGLSIVGTPLGDHTLTKQQKTKTLKALKKIHDHGVLHNDVREENILVDDNGDVFLIDFGMASREDFHKNRRVFNEELRQFSLLLDKYVTNVTRNTGPFSNLRRCKMGNKTVE